jgi:hypothetical protein
VTLVELHLDVTRIADALEKLVFLVERMVYPPPPAEIKIQQATMDDLRFVGEEVIMQMQQEKSEFAQRYNVMPDSPAFAQAIQDWESQMRKIHGEEWKAPEDWKGIFARAQAASGAGGVEAGSSAEAAR